MFDTSETKKAAIKQFAEQLIGDTSHALEMLIDEWHQIDDFHDVHISSSDEHDGCFEVWVYPVYKDGNGDFQTDTLSDDAYEVKLDLPPRVGCEVCKFCVVDDEPPPTRFCFVCRVTEESDD